MAFNDQEHGILLIGWASTLVTGLVYPAMALLFAYGIEGFINRKLASSNLIGLMWFVVAIVEFFGYGTYAWTFGYASERMVRRVRLSSFQAILRQNAAFFDRDDHST